MSPWRGVMLGPSRQLIQSDPEPCLVASGLTATPAAGFSGGENPSAVSEVFWAVPSHAACN